jgi:cytoskeletal protein RodZ
LEVAAETLRIRQAYLEAIEEGRYGDLPGVAYAIGFVRAYADHLGLHAEEVVRRYKEESQSQSVSNTLEFPAPTNEGGLPAGAMVAFALVLAVCAYGAWYWISTSEKPVAELIPDIPERLASMVGGEEQGGAGAEPAGSAAPEAPPAQVAALPPTTETPAAEAPATEATETPAETDGTPASLPEPAPETQAPETQALEAQPEPTPAPALEARPAPKPEAVPEPAPSAPPASASAPQPVSEAAPKPDDAPAPRSETDPAPKPEPAAASLPTPAPTPEPDPVAAAQPAPTPTAQPEPPVPAAAPAPAIETGAAPPPPPAEEVEEKPRAETFVGQPLPSAVASRSQGSRAVLVATNDTWIQVRKDGDLVVRRLLRKGDVYAVPGTGGLKLNVSNAGALEVYVDGRRAPSLGPVGAVRNNIALTPDRLKSGGR